MRTVKMLYVDKTDSWPSIVIKQYKIGFILLEHVMSDIYKPVIYSQDIETVNKEADKLIEAKIRHRKMMEKRY